MSSGREEVSKTEDVIAELRATLNSLGPAHVLYQPLTEELDAIERQLAEIKKSFGI